MEDTTKPKIRHQNETELLHQADRGDIDATNKIFKYLGSNNPGLRQVMQETIRDVSEAGVWHKLLECLALYRWGDQVDCEWRLDPATSERIDQVIIEIFTQDEHEYERSTKVAALRKDLENPEAQIRWTAACLLGLRAEQEVIPLLEETIELGPLEWKLQAVKALGELNDERCGKALVRALAMDRGPLHRAARLALRDMKQLAEPAWMEALNHPNSHIRWHAARGLGELGKVKFVDILAEGLLDSNQAVRWATADVLARLGTPAVPATLTILSQQKINAPIREAAYHALNAIRARKTRKRLMPLLKVMRGPAASVETPLLAQRLLMEWEIN